MPGPICRTTDDVLHWLQRRDQLQAEFAERYATFRSRFAPHDDGGAAGRVAARIWGSEG